MRRRVAMWTGVHVLVVSCKSVYYVFFGCLEKGMHHFFLTC